ncbi:MAG: Asp-tRNA(Asn)/Glu-tRNA(Gln) amidotransferase subunit GatA [Sedimentisphaerales bacterium]|nr:Asp-tRNA(Asn)/Glu-tRNA(Gln) amidotransferase subunit GatA [Sedimentisphaerales bacterium]
MNIEQLSAVEAVTRIKSREMTSREAVEAVFARIEQVEPQVGAYLSLYKQEALQKADAIDARIAAGEPVGILAGLPIAVKDNICTAFGTTTCGSKMLENFRAPYNAHVIELLEKADAVIIGKTNMDEFAMGSSCENSALKKTANPHDPGKVPGGSSGGSAAVVAANMAFVSLGSDTGGSIRQPASFCGVVGLKPTYGRVSRYGLVAYASSLDQIGPFGRNVADTALLMNAIAGYDDRDSTSINTDLAPNEDYLAKLDEPVDGLKIGVVKQFIASEGLHDDVRRSVDEALARYKKMGAEIVEVDMPSMPYSIATYYMVATAECSSNLTRYDGVHYGYRTPNPKDYIDVYSSSRAEGFGAEVKRRIMLGTYALSAGYYDAYYLKALKVRNLIRQDFEKAFKLCDCIMCPTAPETAFAFGEKTNDPLKMYLSDIYTIAVNLAGIPAISIPCGKGDDGMPIGLQIMSSYFTESKLLRIARMYEKVAQASRL